MTDLSELVVAIETAETPAAEREDYLSKLNIYGYGEEQVKEEARQYWSSLFEREMEAILYQQIRLVSHLLDSEEIQSCFQDKFEEYKNRKKDLGIDDIQKFWTPLF